MRRRWKGKKEKESFRGFITSLSFVFFHFPLKTKKKKSLFLPLLFFQKKNPTPAICKKKISAVETKFHGPRYYFELTQPFLLSPVKIQEKQLSWTVITILEDTTRLLSGMFSPWSPSLSLSLSQPYQDVIAQALQLSSRVFLLLFSGIKGMRNTAAVAIFAPCSCWRFILFITRLQQKTKKEIRH